MKRRTSVLLDEHVYEGLQRRARAHGRTVSDEIRVALDASLAGEPAVSDRSTNGLRRVDASETGAPAPEVGRPNAGLLSLAGAFSGASRDAQWVDSDEFSAKVAFEARGPHPAAPPR